MSSIYQSNVKALDVPVPPKNPSMRSSLPFSSSKFLRHSRSASQNFGVLEDFTLSDLIDPEQITLKEPSLINLANFYNNQIKFTDEATKIFDQYKQNPIAFVGVYGKTNAGKSFWCDKTYDLADVATGSNNYQREAKYPQINFCNVPFTKGNIKIFLLDCTGFKNFDLTREQEMRLDAMMFLSSIVVLLPEPTDTDCEIMGIAQKHFTESQKRLIHDGYPAHTRSNYWPHSLYCLYRTTEPVMKDMQNIGNLFYDYNFSIIYDAKSVKNTGSNLDMRKSSFLDRNAINQHYIRHVSWVFKDIYDKIQAKKLGKLKINGQVMSAALPYIQKQFNQHQKIQVHKIADKTTQYLYDNVLKKYKLNHHTKLSEQFRNVKEGQALPLQTVYAKLKTAREATLEEFDDQSRNIDPDSKFEAETEQKLQKLIKEREYQVLESSKKNTQNVLDKSLPRIGSYSINSSQDLQKYLKDLKNTDNKLQHGRSDVVGGRLKQAMLKTKDKTFGSPENQSRLSRINKELQQKKRQYDRYEHDRLLLMASSSKVSQQLKLKKQYNSKLNQELERWKRRSRVQEEAKQISDEDANKIRLKELRRQKQELNQQLERSKAQKQQYERWLMEKQKNIQDQPLVSEIHKKINEKKLSNSQLQQTSYIEKSASISKLRNAERRNLNQAGIKKSRLGK